MCTSGRKLAVVKTLLVDHALVDKRTLDAEVAMTLKMKELFPDLPDELMMKLIPRLEQVKAEELWHQDSMESPQETQAGQSQAHCVAHLRWRGSQVLGAEMLYGDH